VIQLGHRTYSDGNPKVWDYSEPEAPSVTVGKYCSIAADVQFLPGGRHQLHTVSTFPWQRAGRVGHPATTKGPITIGNDVWIGRGARFVGSMTIGNGAIIGAYAVIRHDVPSYHIAIGNPQVHRPRPHHVYADQLNAIAWWDWADDDERLDDVEAMDPLAFASKYHTQ
jgi:acetyltransferase-like isoleucine patch superfamily enzyme